jgi:hypothetical protein
MNPQNNPYEFILDQNSKRSSMGSFKNMPSKNRLFIGVFIAVVLVMTLLLFGLLFGSGDSSQDVKALNAQQTELLRLADLGLESAQSPQARQLAAITKSVISSDLAISTEYLSLVGAKISPAELASRTNSATTEKLDLAKQRNTFDTEFTNALTEASNRYKQDLQNSFAAETGPRKQSLLETATQNILTIFPNQ